jgi:hypothetical protein
LLRIWATKRNFTYCIHPVLDLVLVLFRVNFHSAVHADHFCVGSAPTESGRSSAEYAF